MKCIIKETQYKTSFKKFNNNQNKSNTVIEQGRGMMEASKKQTLQESLTGKVVPISKAKVTGVLETSMSESTQGHMQCTGRPRERSSSGGEEDSNVGSQG